MSFEDSWRPFQRVVEEPWESVRSWKSKTGGKVVGHLIPDVPEELIHAAGALPVALEGAGAQVSHAQAHIPGYTCSHAMGALEMGLRGDLEMLDGVVIPYVCDTTRNLFHIWHRTVPKIKAEFLRLPKRLEHRGTSEYLHAEFTRLMEWVSDLTGHTPGADDLRASLKLYNQSRQMLRKAYTKHLEQPDLWTNERLRLMTVSAMKCAREDHIDWMKALPWDELSSNGCGEIVPVYVRGKIWDPPAISTLMDELDLMVVQDEIVTGFRGISQDAPVDGDPMAGLVKRHLNTVPYTGYHVEPRNMVSSFVDRVKASDAQGVIFLNPKFCEAAAFDTPDFQKGLEKAEIPSLVLETSDRGVSMGQVRLRLEAFHEMLSESLE
jgi:benzoyl-CoA reductase subunit C